MPNTLETLIYASEKAACVARSCCEKSENEVLLVGEEIEGEANARFERDFKTIADVLAQEAAKSEIASRFPDLVKYVRGEECAEVGGIRIELRHTVEDTAELLCTLVPPTVAKRLAEAAHSDLEHDLYSVFPDNLANIDTSDIGIWIDPIDATAEFIAGVRSEADGDKDLSCVTVLIGAYLRSTGESVMGVINQPFYKEQEGRLAWGISNGTTQVWGGTEKKAKDNVILMSGAENPDIIDKFKKDGWEVISVPGAGHKLLKVALGEADAYLVSQGTTFHWDTCAPHSMLRAQGGDIISYTTFKPITYNDAVDGDTQQYCNHEGIIAYSNATVLERIKNLLAE